MTRVCGGTPNGAAALGNTPQRGVALIIALLLVLVLSTLAASAIFLTNTEVWTTNNYRLMVQSRYAAESGAQRTANWLLYSYTAPTSMSSYNTAAYPITCLSSCTSNGSPVLLSAMDGVTANYPDTTVQSAFNTALHNQSLSGVPNASFGATAKLLRMRQITPAFSSTPVVVQSWEITSKGNIAGVRNAQTQVVMRIERQATTTPLFSYAAFATGTGCLALSFGGGGGTDSFDSSAGTYATTEQASGGNIGSNGNISLSGGGGTAPLIKVIDGTVSSATANQTVGNCSSTNPDALTVGSGWTQNPPVPGCTTGVCPTQISALSYPTPPAPSPTPPTTSQNVRNDCSTISGCSCYPSGGYACTNNGPYQLTPGQYGNLLLGGGKVVHVTAGTYNINNFSLNGTLIVDSGPVIVNVAASGIASGTCCAIDFSGGAVSNPGGIPSNFQIVYAGQALIKLSGGASDYGVVYAPNSAVSIGGGGDLYGAVIGASVNNGGGTSIHYDRALGNNGLTMVTLSGYYSTSFSWSKY
jgi:Tfp pilus assembly protein PilX